MYHVAATLSNQRATFTVRICPNANSVVSLYSYVKYMSRIKEKPYNVGATDIIEPTCYKPHRGDGLELPIVITEHFVQFVLNVRWRRLIFK